MRRTKKDEQSKKVKKICFTASSGGHLEELNCLKPLMYKYESFLVTEKCSMNIIKKYMNIYYLQQINRRERMFLIKFLVLFIKSIKILLNEKPDVIISTGALATVPICILGKISNKKIIYIESFARVDSPSLTGKIVYRIADLFIIQWEDLFQFYPKAKFVGGLF